MYSIKYKINEEKYLNYYNENAYSTQILYTIFDTTLVLSIFY